MPFPYPFRRSFSLKALSLAAAAGGFSAANAWAQLPPPQAAQSGAITPPAMQAKPTGQDDSPAPYSPPQAVPIPLPKIAPAAGAETAAPPMPKAPIPPAPAARALNGQQTQNSAAASPTGQTMPAAPQNLPIPSPAPQNPPAAQASPIPQAAQTPQAAQSGQDSSTENIGLGEAQSQAQALADKFSQIRTMTGDFVQFDPKGGMSTGTFYLERPGKILFDYKDTPLRVICDGKTIAVNNRRLDSWNLYELDKSPLNLLLADKINIANGRLLEFTKEPSAVTLILGDSTGRAKIRMIFDAKTYDLKQWTMTDNGQDTTIQVVNTKTDVQFTDTMFNINTYRHPKRGK